MTTPLYSLGAKLFVFVQVQVKEAIPAPLFALPPIVLTTESSWIDTQTLAILLREIAATLHLNLPLGVTNEGQEAIKPISGAVARD